MHHGVMSGERGGIQQGAEAHNRLRCERLASLVTGAGLPRFLEGREASKEQTERRVCRSSRKKWRRGGTSPRWTIDSLAPDAQRMGKAGGVMCESLIDALTQCQASVPCMYACMHACMHVCNIIPAHACVCMCVYVYAYVYIYTYTHTHYNYISSTYHTYNTCPGHTQSTTACLRTLDYLNDLLTDIVLLYNDTGNPRKATTVAALSAYSFHNVRRAGRRAARPG